MILPVLLLKHGELHSVLGVLRFHCHSDVLPWAGIFIAGTTWFFWSNMVNHTVVNLMSLYLVPLAFTVIVIFFHGAGMVTA